MTWRERLLTRVIPPAPLLGVTFGQWRVLLRDNGYDVDSAYRLRAACTTLSSIINSGYGWVEDKVYGAKVSETKVERPLFILGHWRTGTTHLHNLLALDDRLAYPNTYQVSYPNTFLCTEAISSRLGAIFLPPTRPMDNVRVGFAAANEDEFAICNMTACSPYMGLVFSRRRDEYDGFLTFRGVDEDIVARWKSAMMLFLRKLTWKYRRPLVLKSPPDTCRIRLLLEMFPDARFVHIHRNPYHVFESTRHWLKTAAPWWTLQRPEHSGLEERILRTYREMYEVFFDERPLIPPERFYEIGFEELEANPIAALRKLYEALALPDFGHVEPALRRYVQLLSGYKKNVLPELSAGLRQRIGTEWRRCFEKWGYDAAGSRR